MLTGPIINWGKKWSIAQISWVMALVRDWGSICSITDTGKFAISIRRISLKKEENRRKKKTTDINVLLYIS